MLRLDVLDYVQFAENPFIETAALTAAIKSVACSRAIHSSCVRLICIDYCHVQAKMPLLDRV
jgi:hypothetical protein